MHELKITEELCVMTLKNDGKFEEEMTCRFKIEINEFNNFWLKYSKVTKIWTLVSADFDQHI